MNKRKQSERTFYPADKYSNLMLPSIDKRRSSQIKPSSEAHNRIKRLTSTKQLKNVQTKQSLLKDMLKLKQKLPPPTPSLYKTLNLTAKSYGVYDENLTPLTQYKPEDRRQIASLTKMMTLLVTLRLSEKYNVQIKNTYFRISIHASNIVGTIAELDPKQWATVEDLLYGLMLPSGNDASLVLAQNFGAYLYYESRGQSKTLSEIKSLDITKDASFLKLYLQNFVKQMNMLAKQFEMNNTFFVNPHGLDCKEAYSTVRDLSILTKKVMEHPIAKGIICSKNYFARLKISIGKKQTNYRELDWINTHRLMWKKGYLGGKTGQTAGAGNCLVSIYQKDELKYYIVVLGCQSREDRFTDTEKLVNNQILKL